MKMPNISAENVHLVVFEFSRAGATGHPGTRDLVRCLPIAEPASESRFESILALIERPGRHAPPSSPTQ
jgi:hypothetical protein